MALPVILTMVPQSRPFKDGQESCSYDDVSFQYKYSSIQVLFPHSYKFHANRQQSFHEATGKRAWLKGRSPSMNTKSQKLVQMALARSEYIISTDAQKRCIPPPSKSCKLSFFKWREFSWELKSHCCSQLIPCLQLKIGELYMILFICFEYYIFLLSLYLLAFTKDHIDSWLSSLILKHLDSDWCILISGDLSSSIEVSEGEIQQNNIFFIFSMRNSGYLLA